MTEKRYQQRAAGTQELDLCAAQETHPPVAELQVLGIAQSTWLYSKKSCRALLLSSSKP